MLLCFAFTVSCFGVLMRGGMRERIEAGLGSSVIISTVMHDTVYCGKRYDRRYTFGDDVLLIYVIKINITPTPSLFQKKNTVVSPTSTTHLPQQAPLSMGWQDLQSQAQ